jgi:CRISPR-associated protein Cas2
MTVVVTRNVEMRVRGFLASTMLEISSGVYTSPNLTPAVRDRIWDVFTRWNVGASNDGAVMTWPDAQASGGQIVRALGESPLELRETASLVLVRRPLSEDEFRSLTTLLELPPC